MTKIQFEQPVRNLLVDLDGTLLGNRNFPLSLEFITRAVGTMKSHLGGWRHSMRTLLAIRKEFERPSKERTNDIRVIEVFAKAVGVPFEEGRRILREATLTIFPNLKRHFYPMPGAKDFLDWAKDRYPLILATNPVWPTEVIQLRLEWAGIDHRIFRRITDVRTMKACKPTGQYYEEILQLEGLKAKDCLLIGNEMKMDLPAVRVGIPVFIVGDYKQVDKLKYPDAKALAWRGTYAHLRQALETAQPARD